MVTFKKPKGNRGYDIWIMDYQDHILMCHRTSHGMVKEDAAQDICLGRWYRQNVLSVNGKKQGEWGRFAKLSENLLKSLGEYLENLGPRISGDLGILFTTNVKSLIFLDHKVIKILGKISLKGRKVIRNMIGRVDRRHSFGIINSCKSLIGSGLEDYGSV